MAFFNITDIHQEQELQYVTETGVLWTGRFQPWNFSRMVQIIKIGNGVEFSLLYSTINIKQQSLFVVLQYCGLQQFFVC